MNGTKSRQSRMGICALAAAGLFAATQGCSSSNGGAGTGGTAGGGPGGKGTGGSTGGGEGGSTADAGPPCTTLTGTPITDFEPDGGVNVSVGVGMPYGYAATSLTAPTISATGGAMNVTINTGVPGDAMATYAGFGVPFNACVNVASFTGVKFNISGTLTAGCGIQFSLTDQEHSSSPPFGTCTGTCYPGAKVFTLPATATDVTILYTDIGPGGPATPIVTPAKVTGVQWQINVPAAAGDASGCTGSVTIDNVAFVQ